MADKKITELTNYTPPLDADVLPIVDIANNTTKKLTWANIKATLKTYFDTLYAGTVSPTFTGTVVLPTVTAGGDISLAENVSIVLDPALSADGKYSGIVETGTLGETLAFGDTVYFKAADSKWWKTDADAEATCGNVKVGMVVVAGAADDARKILLQGKVRADSKFPTMTIGAPVYFGTTAGEVQVAQPSGTDDVIRIAGYANTADELYFKPSNDYLTHV